MELGVLPLRHCISLDYGLPQLLPSHKYPRLQPLYFIKVLFSSPGFFLSYQQNYYSLNGLSVAIETRLTREQDLGNLFISTLRSSITLPCVELFALILSFPPIPPLVHVLQSLCSYAREFAAKEIFLFVFFDNQPPSHGLGVLLPQCYRWPTVDRGSSLLRKAPLSRAWPLHSGQRQVYHFAQRWVAPTPAFAQISPVAAVIFY